MEEKSFITKREFYGRELASWINFTLNSVPENKRNNYKKKLIEIINAHEFQIRKKDDPLTQIAKRNIP